MSTDNHPKRVVLATGNQGKLREFQQELGDFFDLITQSELGISSPPETGLSFVENAILKARHAAAVSGLPALADDSGLCVDALKGAPGIYSARFAGEDSEDGDNNTKLLEQMRGREANERSAHFVCVLAYMRHGEDPEPLVFHAAWNGKILDAPRGENGFGYDPLFQPEDLDCTSAELSPVEKNQRSHRGQAINKLLGHLRDPA